VVAITAVVMTLAIKVLPGFMSFPRMILEAPSGFRLDVVLFGRAREAPCREDLLAVRAVLHPICGDCKIVSEQCIGADPTMLRWLSADPLESASITMPGGTMVLDSPDQPLALTVCRYIAGQKDAGMRCNRPGEFRGR
jgi:hypothetical protein